MKNKISFVAVGQAAGNIGKLFEQKGYAVIYVNTSQEDLDTLKKAKFKYHIPQGEGCNKDRRKAQQLVIDDFDNIAAEIESKVKADMIFVIFASGGGTGSGAGPMLIDLLIDEGKTVGAITIIPAPDESPKSHMNSYECFSELTKISGTGSCFIIDNENGEKLELNAVFVDSLAAFLEIPEKHKSIKGNIDKAEIMETLKAHGVSVVVCSKGKADISVISVQIALQIFCSSHDILPGVIGIRNSKGTGRSRHQLHYADRTRVRDRIGIKIGFCFCHCL